MAKRGRPKKVDLDRPDDRIMGIETEYMLGRGQNQRFRTISESDPFLDMLIQYFSNHAACYTWSKGSTFWWLPNGGFLHMDCGHPEFSTPEAANPMELVRFVRDGDLALRGFCNFARKREGWDGFISRCNTSFDQTTWGSHESYAVRTQPEFRNWKRLGGEGWRWLYTRLARQLSPHLATRIIYTGAGGLSQHDSSCFVLSPRSEYIEKAEPTSDTQYSRSLINTKEEDLSNDAGLGLRRLHLICGESICSDIGLYLRVGTTSLILALIERGIRPAHGLKMVPYEDAVSSLNIVNKDLTFTKIVAERRTRQYTAIEVQRLYLDQVVKRLNEPWMPSWAPRVVALWSWVLDLLSDGGAESATTVLDWALKYRLLAKRLSAYHKLTDERHRDRYLSSEEQRYNHRNAIYEIDARFGDVHEDGIFNRLDYQGLLNHSVPEWVEPRPKRVQRLLPTNPRARVRSLAVNNLQGQDTRVTITWDQIIHGRHVLNLADPFKPNLEWFDSSSESSRRRSRRSLSSEQKELQALISEHGRLG